MELYETSVGLALRAHATQVRKTDGSPYITHPLTVAYIVSKHTSDETIVAAALLHDTLEDTSVGKEELVSLVGQDVVRIIEAVSENTDLPWEVRKAAYVESVLAGGEAVWLVSVADKVHNATCLVRELKAKGDSVWSSFNRGKVEKLWFENLLCSTLKMVWTHPLLLEYEALILEIERL